MLGEEWSREFGSVLIHILPGLLRGAGRWLHRLFLKDPPLPVPITRGYPVGRGGRAGLAEGTY